MDTGIIYWFKVGYLVRILETLLFVFDIEEGYETLENRRRQPPRGCMGISVVGKPTICDIVLLSANMWNLDAKYDL